MLIDESKCYACVQHWLFTDDDGTKTPPPSPVEGDFVSGTMMW